MLTKNSPKAILSVTVVTAGAKDVWYNEAAKPVLGLNIRTIHKWVYQAIEAGTGTGNKLYWQTSPA